MNFNLDLVNENLIFNRYKNGRLNDAPCVCSSLDTCMFTLALPRKLGASGVMLELTNDFTSENEKILFEFKDTDYINEKYTCTLKLDTRCNTKGEGLFYYTLCIMLGEKSVYLSSINGVDYELCEDKTQVNMFTLLVHNDAYKTPDWAKNSVMYHIFVDRFFKTKDKITVKDGAYLNDDWNSGKLKYPEKDGDPIDNNEFFGGSLYGVIEKLDYLLSLGVNCIYLSPIFSSHSNHKYDTADYMSVDEMFGGNKAFYELIKQAKKRNIHIILDGVFNHTGSDSIYFDKDNKYSSNGAFNNKNSPYRDWYYFDDTTGKYESWWGIEILPKLNLENNRTRDYFLSSNGVVRKYLKDGISGWRLDVADELPSEFLDDLRTSVKSENNDALIIGEVWENAAYKISYGKRRKYFSGHQLDSVMNYPVKNAIIDYMRTCSEEFFYNTLCEIYSCYPEESASVLMNVLGTHDTPRILTSLVSSDEDFNLSNDKKACLEYDDVTKEQAVRLLKIASCIQFTLPGIPCVYYGDESEMYGMGDPFCRKPYNWENQNSELVEHYRKLGRMKRSTPELSGGKCEFIFHGGGVCVYKRTNEKINSSVFVVVNMSENDYLFSEKGDIELVFGTLSFIKESHYVPPKSIAVIRMK